MQIRIWLFQAKFKSCLGMGPHAEHVSKKVRQLHQERSTGGNAKVGKCGGRAIGNLNNQGLWVPGRDKRFRMQRIQGKGGEEGAHTEDA